ncbi:MAG: hypothetical protein ICV87_01200 [Gemmatimonadetes bacterium]|nr:hypothetical protein [Gemmatimonadota bacterium]
MRTMFRMGALVLGAGMLGFFAAGSSATAQTTIGPQPEGQKKPPTGLFQAQFVEGGQVCWSSCPSIGWCCVVFENPELPVKSE